MYSTLLRKMIGDSGHDNGSGDSVQIVYRSIVSNSGNNTYCNK